MDYAAVVVLLVLSGARAHSQGRCPPDVPPFDPLGSGNSSAGGELVSSGSGLGRPSCEELDLEGEGVLLALNYYCRHVFAPSPDCESESCKVCEVLVACGVPSTPSDVCSSEILLSCSALPVFPYVDDIYSGVCDYAASTCLSNSSTGVCASKLLIQTCSLTAFYNPWPCDCFLPNATCDLCELVMLLCPDGNDGSSGGSGNGSDFCSYLNTEEGTGYVFLCQFIPPEGPCPFSYETCFFCSYINMGECGHFPTVTISDLCALSRLVTACDFPSIVADSEFFFEICSYIAVSDCGGNGSTCVGEHCPLCNYLSRDEGLGYVFLCHSFSIHSYCPYSNETCGYCEFIASGACTNLPHVSHSDLCKISSLVSACEYYPGETEFFLEICPFTSMCTGVSGSGLASGGGSGFFGSGSAIGSGSLCSQVEVGFVYYCLSSFAFGECPSQSICHICELLLFCPDLTLPSTREVCSHYETVFPCMGGQEDLGDYCSHIMGLCLASDDSGICELQDLVTDCIILATGEACSLPRFAEICGNCFSILNLCVPEPSISLSFSQSQTMPSVGFPQTGSSAPQTSMALAIPTSMVAESAPTTSTDLLSMKTMGTVLGTSSAFQTTSSLLADAPISSPMSALLTTLSPVLVVPTSSLVSAAPSSSTTSPVQIERTSSPEPTSSPVQTEPTSSPVQTEPTSSPVQAEPTSSPVQAEPTSSPVQTEPTSSPVQAEPTSSPVQTEPMSSLVLAEPTSSPVQAEPTSSPVQAEPTPSSSSSEPTVIPSPTASTSTFPEGTAVDISNLSKEQAENTVSLEIQGIKVGVFLEKEQLFRRSIADALNKAIDLTQKKRQKEEFTADDVTYVGQPVATDGGGVVVAFFAEYPDGQRVVDGSDLAKVLDDNSDDISDAAGGKVRGIKKGVPEALRPDGDGTDSTGSSGDDGGLSGAAVAAIVVMVLIVAVLVAVAVAGAVLVWFRRNRQSFMIVTGGSATSDPSRGESARGGKSGRAFPMRAGSNTYVPVPATAMAANRGEVDDQDKGKGEDEATERDPLEEGLKITHL